MSLCLFGNVWCWCRTTSIPPGSTPRACTLANSLCCLWMVRVGITQHARHSFLIVRAQATVPQCHPPLSHLNPHVLPIHSSVSQVPDFLLEPTRPHRNAADTGIGENPKSGKRSYTTVSFLGERERAAVGTG